MQMSPFFFNVQAFVKKKLKIIICFDWGKNLAAMRSSCIFILAKGVN
jgi:hypothetical protein